MADDDHDHQGHDDHQGSPRRAIFGLVIILVGIVATLFIMQQLRHAAQIQDCVASGRTNCAPIDSTSH
jgi:hypothetical protein